MTGRGEMTVGATGDIHWIAQNKPGMTGRGEMTVGATGDIHWIAQNKPGMTGRGEMTVGATGDIHWIARSKPGNDAPSRRHSRHPSRPRRRRDDWGVGNPEEQRQPPWHSR